MEENKSGQVENILSELGRKIDELVEAAKEKKGDVKVDLDSTIEDLKKQKSKLESEWQDFKETGEDRWEKSKPHLVSALTEIKEAFKLIFKNN